MVSLLLMKPKPPNPADIMTTPQVCRTLSITRQTLYNWLNNGKLKPWMKVGGASWLFTKVHIATLQGTKHKKVVVRSRSLSVQSK